MSASFALTSASRRRSREVPLMWIVGIIIIPPRWHHLPVLSLRPSPIYPARPSLHLVSIFVPSAYLLPTPFIAPDAEKIKGKVLNFQCFIWPLFKQMQIIILQILIQIQIHSRCGLEGCADG